MNNDTALILLLADRQREIEALRAEVANLRAQLGELEQALQTTTAPDSAQQ